MDMVDIVGAGGIGCAVGYALSRAGIRVRLIETNLRKLHSGQRGHLRVGHRAPRHAEFLHFDDWTPISDRWVLLCTKCYNNGEVLERLSVPVRLIPIQNGFDPQLDECGHAFEGIASFVSECSTHDVCTRITRGGELYFGSRTQHRAGMSPPAFIQPLRDAAKREGLFRVVEVPDISPIKYTKLMYNAAISPLAAAAGIDNGQLLSYRQARTLFFELLQENYHILRSAGISLGRVGPFHPTTVAWILRRQWLAKLLGMAFEPSLRGTYCSMAGEIQLGRTELDNYNGYLIRLAERTGAPCPVNRAVYELVNGMTQRRELPSLTILDHLNRSARRIKDQPIHHKTSAVPRDAEVPSPSV